MSIISQLSSQVGDRTEDSNEKVVAKCLKNPELLKEIAEGLLSNEDRLVGDCAEVFTKVAETNPELAAPFAIKLVHLLDHKFTRARWEGTHALEFIAELVPNIISSNLSTIHRMSLSDQSTIVRDNCATMVGNYAKTSKKAAQASFPVLKRILEVWKDKQASRVLKGLQNVAEANSQTKDEVLNLVKAYENHSRASVKKTAKEVLKALQK